MKTPWHRLSVQIGGERYIATLYEGRRNWSAHVPRLPGLAVTGPYVHGTLDREQARRKIAEGIQFHLEGLALEDAERKRNRIFEPVAVGTALPAGSESRDSGRE